ncbi:MAG: DUF177 domain-containing protein [Bacteroidetes bacterium]|nr:DUF177 domain-containing protein [Bacteroidota bacterium]MBT3747538.1 DUF177 domain-containing protein [Bacteroidota bacterium]MBT4398175.1 DUF177 domain-containing protein [Bacteroidota bacterium]MBT4409466.1 DUF177 domain-containing protein [Bacteroidota bacterium]MBT7462596.1 DUF177 domain-containing protein [Bacteroidota bacterium]
MNTYRIPFYSFGNGKHEFEFDLDDDFFTYFEDSEFSHGDVKVKVKMDKSDHQLQFDLSLNGDVEVSCDRCLDQFMQELDSKYILYGKFGEGNSEEEFDVVWIPRNEHEVDLAPYLYEYIVLSLPIKRIHPDKEEGVSGCDEDMMNRLDEIVLLTEE